MSNKTTAIGSGGIPPAAIKEQPVDNPPTIAPQIARLLDPTADFSTINCAVNQLGAEGEVTFLVEPDIWRRIKSRAGSQNLAEYFWENILKRALMNHVY